ncbi:hypothetical protein BC938DRAFT_472629 [Jimgerdemannia flammicorona]|uniref:Uncharacterized protein n=1 Tax=Jimgerdemannia flammicorona TaxID=994334 RepID=A0A433Q5P0_9FUNG|nr:hypothetical protein BC938DRAFT_472629 [Jimgerdemannia flammicorona]
MKHAGMIPAPSSVKDDSWPKLSGDSRFLLSRVLFLMTVDCLDVVRLLIDDLNVADSIALVNTQTRFPYLLTSDVPYIEPPADPLRKRPVTPRQPRAARGPHLAGNGDQRGAQVALQSVDARFTKLSI